MAKLATNPPLPSHQWARATREWEEYDSAHNTHWVQELKLSALRLSASCRCGQLSCPKCGFARFHARVHQIEARARIRIGYLTGGSQNKTLSRLAA